MRRKKLYLFQGKREFALSVDEVLRAHSLPNNAHGSGPSRDNILLEESFKQRGRDRGMKTNPGICQGPKKIHEKIALDNHTEPELKKRSARNVVNFPGM